jgi:hypothetical protein
MEKQPVSFTMSESMRSAIFQGEQQRIAFMQLWKGCTSPIHYVDRGRRRVAGHVGAPDRDLANVAPIGRRSRVKVIDCTQKKCMMPR